MYLAIYSKLSFNPLFLFLIKPSERNYTIANNPAAENITVCSASSGINPYCNNNRGITP